MKRLFALFFSIVLMVMQTAFTTGAAEVPGTGKPQCCGHCSHCKGQSCCLGKKNSDSHPSAPAVPAHNLSQNDWQVLAASALHLLPQTAAEPVTFAASFFIPSTVAAPLYQRNCSYLI